MKKSIKILIYTFVIVFAASIYFFSGWNPILLNLIILNIFVYFLRTILIDIIEGLKINILTKYLSILVVNIIWLIFVFSLLFVLSPTFFVAIISFLVVAISLTFQNVINNIASGIMLLSSGGLEAGDFLDINGVEGIVKEITLNHIKLITYDGSITYIPNKNAFNAPITRYTHKPLAKSKKIDIKKSLKKLSKMISGEKKLTRYVKVLELMNYIDVDELGDTLKPVFDKYEETFGKRPFFYVNNSVSGLKVRLSITLQILTDNPELILRHTNQFLKDIIYEIYKDDVCFGWNNKKPLTEGGEK